MEEQAHYDNTPADYFMDASFGCKGSPVLAQFLHWMPSLMQSSSASAPALKSGVFGMLGECVNLTLRSRRLPLYSPNLRMIPHHHPLTFIFRICRKCPNNFFSLF